MALTATARNSRDNHIRPNNIGPAVRNNRRNNRRTPNNRRQRNNTAGIRRPTTASIRQATARQVIGSRDTNASWSREFNREFDRLFSQTGGGNHHPCSHTPIRRELDQINRLRVSSDRQSRRYVDFRFGGIEDQLSLIHHNIKVLDKELGRHPMKTQFEIATEPLLKAAVSFAASLALCLIAIFSGDKNQGIILGILLSIVALGSLRALGGQSFKSARSCSGSAPARTHHGSGSTSRSS
jgi:hypothetical protein